MNLFEKIFNYQIMTRLDEAGSFALTSQERSWLRMMLGHADSADAFSPDTSIKLQALLDAEPPADVSSIIIEKAKSRERQVYHPLLRTLRRMIMRGQGIQISYRLKNGDVRNNQLGMPCKLEYNMAKRTWYLLWCQVRDRSLMSTKLHSIEAVSEVELPDKTMAGLRDRLVRTMAARQRQGVIRIMPAYNDELSRILYAFSCFEKTVSYDEAVGLYRIRITFLADESEFLLSRIRFLGLRVKVVEGDHLIRRMRETADWSVARYADSTFSLPQKAADR